MQTDTDHTFMQAALEQARQAMPLDVPVGAVMVYEGRIIATGFNTRERDQNPTGHAELSVLKQASTVLENWRLPNTQLYVTLEPCVMCAGAILQARVGSVIFGAGDSIIGGMGGRHQLVEAGHHLIVRAGIMEVECRKLLQTFFESKRSNIEYPSGEASG